MNTNFNIVDAVILEFSGTTIDLRAGCKLIGLQYNLADENSVEFNWKILDSNKFLRFQFKDVEYLKVSGRDHAYPQRSGSTLAIAGYTVESADRNGEYFVEPQHGIEYFSFAMDDHTVFTLKASCSFSSIV